MRVLLQRVVSAQVAVDSNIIGEISKGWLLLCGFAHADTQDVVIKMADKILGLRLFPDEQGKFNKSVKDVGGELLVVSQFTLYADCAQGRRPGFQNAAKPEHAKRLYEDLILEFQKSELKVATGEFGANMLVSLINDGPVTVMMDSVEWSK